MEKTCKLSHTGGLCIYTVKCASALASFIRFLVVVVILETGNVNMKPSNVISAHHPTTPRTMLEGNKAN